MTKMVRFFQKKGQIPRMESGTKKHALSILSMQYNNLLIFLYSK
ncbi:MAG: hypothetical protein ACI9XO_002540 [Paraglaciecola sp.]|jgi:hypothetical protein